MGIKGINLAGYRRKHWFKQAVKNIMGLTATLLITFGMASGLIYLSFGIEAEINQQHQLISKLKQTQDKTEQQIASLKQHHRPQAVKLSSDNVQQFMQLLTQLNLKGALESSQLYIDEFAKIKLMGNVNSSSQFEQLANQLKQQQFQYKIEQFQTNDKNQLTFSLVIDLKGKQNEKLDH